MHVPLVFHHVCQLEQSTGSAALAAFYSLHCRVIQVHHLRLAWCYFWLISHLSVGSQTRTHIKKRHCIFSLIQLLCRRRIQVPAWVGTAVPHRWTLPTSWSRGSTVTSLGLVFITDCPPNSTLHRRRSSLPGRRCSCLEQSATARHFCAFSSRLKTHFVSVSFPEQFWTCSACEVNY